MNCLQKFEEFIGKKNNSNKVLMLGDYWKEERGGEVKREYVR